VYLLPGSFMLLFAGPIAGRIGFADRLQVAPRGRGCSSSRRRQALIAAFHSHPWQIWVNQGLLGIGIGFAFASMATLIAEKRFASRRTGVATGMKHGDALDSGA